MVMDIASYVKSMLKTDTVSIDNLVFRLHYRVTVAILLASSFIGVAKQYFGDPINCQTSSGVESKVLDDYCWIHSTFQIRSEYQISLCQGYVGCLLDPELVRDKLIHSGAEVLYYEGLPPAPGPQGTGRSPDTSFYQWVPLVLVIQAGIFYIPRRIWKSCHAKINRVLARGEGGDESSVTEDLVKKQSALFINSISHNTGYFITFLCCEFLNLLVVLANIYLTDFFLEGRFLKYGTQVLVYLSHDRTSRIDKPNPLCTVFPTVTSCSFHSVGTAAGEQKFNSLCILSLNIVNEKIYLLLWFWLFSLLAVSGVQLVARLTVILLPPARTAALFLNSYSYRLAHLQTIRSVVQNCSCSDWFVLYQLTSNNQRHLSIRLMKHLQKYFHSCQKLKTRKHSAEARKRREFYSDDDEIYSKPAV